MEDETMTLTLSEPEPKKARKAAKPKPALSAEALRARIAQIDAGNTHLGREGLMAALAAEGIVPVGMGSSGDKLTIDGVSCQTTAGLHNLLSTWCSKARRAILNGEAV
jgi:hypothetical protein